MEVGLGFRDHGGMAKRDARSLGLGIVGDDVTIHDWVRLIAPDRISIGSHVIVDDFVLLQGGAGLELGSYVHIASFASVTGGGPTRIGHFATVSSGARVFAGTDVPDGTGLVNSTVPADLRSVVRPGVRIEDFAFFGANAVVLPGVIVGEGAVLGAGAVAIADARPWTVYVGAPARGVGDRPRAAILERARGLGWPWSEAAVRPTP
jgi:acetyltransferase-like isoleucine patch superfamily enzyme